MASSMPRSMRRHSGVITRLFRFVLIGTIKLRITRVTVIGREHIIDTGGVIVACNHVSTADPVYLWGALRRNAAAIAMQELWSWPVVGQVVQLMGHIPVMRGNRESGRRAIRRGVRVLQAGGIVFIFPEGEISPDDQLLTLKSGVYNLATGAGVKVIPTGIRGTQQVKPLESWRVSLRHPVELRFGLPMDARDFTGPEARVEFLDELARQIAGLSGQKCHRLIS